MPEVRAPLYREGIGITTIVIAKLPVLSKKDVKAIRPRLYKGANLPVEFLDNEEVLAVVGDGYILSGIGRMSIEYAELFIEDIRRLYKADDRVKVWIN